jgi:hypothetical protein
MKNIQLFNAALLTTLALLGCDNRSGREANLQSAAKQAGRIASVEAMNRSRPYQGNQTSTNADMLRMSLQGNGIANQLQEAAILAGYTEPSEVKEFVQVGTDEAVKIAGGL